MIGLLRRLFAGDTPDIVLAGPRDASDIAALHGAAFRRGWSDAEVEGLIAERNVLAHVARRGRTVAGFIMSRSAADEAEILSVAVGRSWRGRGLARALLTAQLRRLAGAGTRTVFLEVDENNAAALALYRRLGYVEVGRRKGYYRTADGKQSTALVLRLQLQ